MKIEKNAKFPLNDMVNWWEIEKNAKFLLNNMVNWREIEEMQKRQHIPDIQPTFKKSKYDDKRILGQSLPIQTLTSP